MENVSQFPDRAEGQSSVSELLELQEKTERKFWKYKGLIEVAKISFLLVGGLVRTREGLIVGIVGAAICQGVEYMLNYHDYDDHKAYSKALDRVRGYS